MSANGVEGHHQLSPSNSADIAEILLAAGAEVDATTDVYEGKCTALGLVATSRPPFVAGVQRQVIDVLLKYGAQMGRLGIVVNAEIRGFSEGHTALHVAAYQGHVDLVVALLRRGALVDVKDQTWHTTPLVWAATGWSRKPSPGHYDIVARLVRAGAAVTPDMLEWSQARQDTRMFAALHGDCDEERARPGS